MSQPRHHRRGLAQVRSFSFHSVLITSLYGCPCFIDGETEARKDDVSFVRSPMCMWQSEKVPRKFLLSPPLPCDAFLICCVNWVCLSWRTRILLKEILRSSGLGMTTCVHIYITLFFTDMCLTGALSKVTKDISWKADLTWYLGAQTTGQGYSDLQLKWTTWQPEYAAIPCMSPSCVSVLSLLCLQMYK